MSDTFDFEAFISGATADLERYEIPLYRVLHQARIDELDAQIKEATEKGSADERESSTGTTELVAERDRLVKEQDDSATWLELRSLSSQEFSDLTPADKTLFDQLAAQTEGTRNPMTAEQWRKVKASVLHGAFTLFLARANEIVERTLVVPDFSLPDSATHPESSAN
jgi:hypothetical protein